MKLKRTALEWTESKTLFGSTDAEAPVLRAEGLLLTPLLIPVVVPALFAPASQYATPVGGSPVRTNDCFHMYCNI